MKILLITTVFPSPLRPGQGTFNKEMVRALSAEHEVKVVSPVAWPDVLRAPNRFRRLDVVAGIDTHYPVYFYTPKICRRWYGEFFWCSVRGTLRSLARGFRPDVVMGYWAHPDGQAAVRFARRIGAPSVVMVGGSDILALAADQSRRRSIRRVLEQADAVVAVSQDLRHAITAMDRPVCNVHVVYRGVDTKKFHRGDRADARARLGLPANVPALLWVGRMVGVKGLEVLVDACARARERADFRLYLVGDGPLRAQLGAQAAALGVADRVQFVGNVPHDDLGDWYRAADLTVLPSRSEGVPNVLLESIACGTPLIASRVGGIPEIADPMVDRLVAPGDPASLADAIVSMLAAPSHFTHKFTPRSMAEASSELAQVLANVKASPSRESSPFGAWLGTAAARARAMRIW